MKRIILTLGMVLFCTIATTMAQKFALIDREYILNNIPAYEMTNEQINQLSEKWQAEVEKLKEEVSNMYKTFQSDLVFLSEDMKTKRISEIAKKEQEAQNLQRKYFGADGELYKKRESLLKPIFDEIFEATKAIAEDNGYQVVWDRASDMSIIYANPRIDISNEVLLKMGYSK
jgi:Outer membrane protein